MIDLGHQGEHRPSVLGWPFVRLQRDGQTEFTGRRADRPEVPDHHRAFAVARRLTGTRDHDGDPEPAAREPDSPQGQVEPVRRQDVRAADVAAAHLDCVVVEQIEEGLCLGIAGLLGNDGRFGDHQAAEVVPAQGEFQVLKASRPQPLGRDPDALRPKAVREATDDAFHGPIQTPTDRPQAAFDLLDGDRDVGEGVGHAEGPPAREDIKEYFAADLNAPAGRQVGPTGFGTVLDVPADQFFEVVRGADERGGHLLPGAAVGQRRGEEVDNHRHARPIVVSLGMLGELLGGDRLRLGDPRKDLLTLAQEVGTVEIAEGFDFRAAARLAFGDRHEQVIAEHLAERSVLPPCLLGPPVREPTRHLQAPPAQLVKARELPPTRFVVAVLDQVERVAQLLFNPLGSPQLPKPSLDAIGQREQVADVVDRVTELRGSQRATPPVGPGLAAEDRLTERLRDQVPERERVAEPHEPGRDSGRQKCAGGPCRSGTGRFSGLRRRRA